AARMGLHGLRWPQPDPGPVVDLHLSRHRNLHREPRVQPDGRRPARRSRSAGAVMSGKPILDVQKLNIRFNTPAGINHVVRDVSFTLGREKLAIVGESGSGKSQTARAILGLTPGMVSAQRLEFDGQNLLGLTNGQWRQIRGRRITMVMQDPKYSLNPVMR